eukprot:10398428-Alexandrium_andersonii.AAC.1
MVFPCWQTGPGKKNRHREVCDVFSIIGRACVRTFEKGCIELASSADQFSYGSLHKLPQALTALKRRLGESELTGECLLL